MRHRLELPVPDEYTIALLRAIGAAIRHKWELPVPEDYAIALLRAAGCRDEQPLLGWRPQTGPRCRLCNTVAPLVTAIAWEKLKRWARS